MSADGGARSGIPRRLLRRARFFCRRQSSGGFGPAGVPRRGGPAVRRRHRPEGRRQNDRAAGVHRTVLDRPVDEGSGGSAGSWRSRSSQAAGPGTWDHFACPRPFELSSGKRSPTLSAGHRQAKRPCVVIFDHLDRALPDCQQAVERLLLHDAEPGAATFVLAFSGHSFPVIARQWRQAADLRIEVAPLTAEETAGVRRTAASRSGASPRCVRCGRFGDLVPSDAGRAAGCHPSLRALTAVGDAG